MSVGPIGGSSLPDPGFFSYPSTSSESGSATAASSASSAAPSTGSAVSSTGPTAAAAAQNPYQSAYANLVQQDTAELLQVSFGSSSDAQSNVASVLAQAAALQQQQLAAQQQAQTAAPAPITAPVTATLAGVLQQSDAGARSDLANGTLGASIDAQV